MIPMERQGPARTIRSLFLVPILGGVGLVFVLKASALGQTVLRSPMELVMERYFQQNLDYAPLGYGVRDFCAKAPLDDALILYKGYRPYVMSQGNESNSKSLLRIIMGRSDLRLDDIKDRLYQMDYWKDVQRDFEDIQKSMEVAGKMVDIQTTPTPNPPTSEVPGKYIPHMKKARRAYAYNPVLPGTPQPTPYPLDPVYETGPDMHLEGLTRAFLRTNDPVEQAAILSQMQLGDLGSLQGFLFDQLMDRLQKSQDRQVVLTFLSRLGPWWRSKKEGFSKFVIALPFDKDPEIRGVKLKVLLQLREPEGADYIFKTLPGCDAIIRRDFIETLVDYQNFGRPGDAAGVTFKEGLQKTLLTCLEEEKTDSGKVVLLKTLARNYQDVPGTLEAIRDLFSRSDDIEEGEAKALADFKDKDLVPMLLALAHFPSVEDKVVRTLSSLKDPDSLRVLLTRLRSPVEANNIRWKELPSVTRDLVQRDMGTGSVDHLLEEEKKTAFFSEKEVLLKALAGDPDILDDETAKDCVGFLVAAPTMKAANGLGNILNAFTSRALYEGVEAYCQQHPDWAWLGTGVCLVARSKAEDQRDIPFLQKYLDSNVGYAQMCAREGLRNRGSESKDPSPVPAAR